MEEIDVALLYSEWKRLYCGPRDMIRLIRKPKWKMAISAPWMWWSHFRVACQYTTVTNAARISTLFVWAFLNVGSVSKRIGELPVKVWTKEPLEVK